VDNEKNFVLTAVASIIAGATNRLNIGDKIRRVLGHCNPTVNRYDWHVCIRRNRVEQLSPITARGADVLVGYPAIGGRTTEALGPTAPLALLARAHESSNEAGVTSWFRRYPVQTLISPKVNRPNAARTARRQPRPLKEKKTFM
jgi:hypothetical protein